MLAQVGSSFARACLGAGILKTNRRGGRLLLFEPTESSSLSSSNHETVPIMQSHEIVEFTGWVATNADLLLRSSMGLSMDAIAGYWQASRYRFESWSRNLRRHSQQLCTTPARDIAPLWHELSPTLDEILSAELLTRVMGAIGAVYEDWTGDAGPATLTRNTWLHHLDIRRRTLNLLLFGHGLGLPELVAWNERRRRHEAWTDRLLCCLPAERCVREFAFCQKRLGEKAIWTPVEPHQRATRNLILVGLRAAYRPLSLSAAPNPELNGQVVAAILTCFSPGLFDMTGLPKSMLAPHDASTTC